VNEQQSNQEVIKLLFFNRKQIALFTVLFLLLTLITTFFIPKKYTATGIIYPTKSNSMKDVVNNPVFGYELQADRLLQLLQSQRMQEMVVNKFDLISYYEIDTTLAGEKNSLQKNYLEDFSFQRTKYLSVEISAEMNNPELAANVVNSMINYIDTIRRDIFLENTIIWVNELEQRVTSQELIVDSLLMAVFNSNEPHSNNSIAKSKSAHINARQKNAIILQGDKIVQNAILTNYSVQLEKLINQYYMELGILNRFQSDLNQGKEKLSLPFPKVYTVTQAEVDDKKTSPSFLKNGIIGLVAGFLLSVFFFLGINKWNSFSNSFQDI
jgi:uncharacterized protein involved in exopolysaccharide biosynthesis